jgi:hypothetical protein
MAWKIMHVAMQAWHMRYSVMQGRADSQVDLKSSHTGRQGRAG